MPGSSKSLARDNTVLGFRKVDDPPPPRRRKRDSHKGTFGHVFVVAGSQRMMGAALLCSEAATRAGAGLVTLGCPRSLQRYVAPACPTTISIPLPETFEASLALGAWPAIKAFCENATVLALGPGLSRHPATALLARRIVERVELPLVIDADGLNAVSEDVGVLKRAKGPVVVTPHPGEMSRLIGAAIGEIQGDRKGFACRFAKQYNVTVVLKGAGTVVAGGGRVYINDTGNPYMASGGTGDVLTGMIAGLLAHRMSPFDAARTAAYWHGLIGDEAPNAAGPGAVTAADLVDHLQSSTTDLDWYHEELHLEDSHVFDPDREDGSDNGNGW
jgi:NAD(P)H-hydrate epimerase